MAARNWSRNKLNILSNVTKNTNTDQLTLKRNKFRELPFAEMDSFC